MTVTFQNGVFFMSDLRIQAIDFTFETSGSGVTIKRHCDEALHISNNLEVATVLGAMFMNATPPIRTALLPLIFAALP
jgi:hypothetical protein